MSNPSSQDLYRDRWLKEVGQSRGLLLAVGTACIILGAIAAFVPWRLFGSFAWLLGILMLASAAAKSLQFVIGLTGRSKNARRRNLILIALQVALDVGLGWLLINHQSTSASVFALIFGLLFLLEGLVLFIVGVKSPTTRGRYTLWAVASVTACAGLAIVFRLVPNEMEWAGVLVGAKLALFGIALVLVALKAPSSEPSLIYSVDLMQPEVAELYAVYFGTAFHLGVFVGDNKIVHYLDDNQVHHVTWEQFLEGRDPQHWTYPDLPPVDDSTIVATALSEVGKTYPYSLLKFNCENFAIFCKSGGSTKTSLYAQVPASVANVVTHPFVGMVAEVNTRIFEWLAFHLGGASGKKLSLKIRRLGSIITAALVRPSTSKKQESRS